MSVVSEFFSAVASTFKGNDGNISSRKTTAFFFVVIAGIEALSVIIMQWLIIGAVENKVTADTIEGMKVLYDFYVATCLMILLLFGIISMQNIIDLKTFKTAEVKKEEIKQENL